jgi:hypothetical protein
MSNKTIIEGKEKFNTVEKLHNFLTILINQGKKDFEIEVDNADYSYENIEEVRIYDDTKKVILY